MSSTAFVKDTTFPVTVTWVIPSTATAGTYVASAILTDSQLVDVIGSVSEPFYIGINPTATTPIPTVTTTPVTTSTSPSLTTTTLCPVAAMLCSDGKTMCPSQLAANGCYLSDCSKCPQPQNNVLVYVVLVIVLLIVIFSILKHYKKI